MEKLIVANWKMNNNFDDIPEYVKFLKKNAKREKNLVVCVPSVMIKEFSTQAKKLAKTGAQNCFYEKNGAFTGEISPEMAKSAGASYVLVGHSERRHNFGETNEIISKKIKAVSDAGLIAIFCIGESLEEKSKYRSVLKAQILEGLSKMTTLSNVVIAYEPIWAIGTGKVATTVDIAKVHKFIKETVKEHFGVEAKVIYGGSIKPTNSAEILALDEVDGVLVGGASLNADDFVKIAKSR